MARVTPSEVGMTLYHKGLDDRVVLQSLPANPGAGWRQAASLQAAIELARAARRPLFILPGTIETGAIDLDPTGGRLQITAAPGTVTIRLAAAAPHLLRVEDVPDLVLDGLAFDGDGHALTQAVGSVGAGLIRVTGRGSSNARIAHCTIAGSAGSGVLVDGGASATVTGCGITGCDTAVTALDGLLTVTGCTLADCGNNGIVVVRSTQGEDGALIQSNRIGRIANRSGGSGPYGNGILVFRAGGVRITDNRIEGCAFSGVRVNGGDAAQIVANTLSDIREHAIYIEAPDAALDTNGGIVANNIVTRAGAGIAVANLGRYHDGTTRRVTVTGNQLSQLRRNPIPPPYTPDRTLGAGIVVEGTTTVSANTVDGAATAGIILGTNDAALDLVCDGNYVTNCPMGIGFSGDRRAGSLLITSNLVTRYREGGDEMSGAIVAVAFDGVSYRRAGGTDYGNVGDQQVGGLRVAHNRATP